MSAITPLIPSPVGVAMPVAATVAEESTAIFQAVFTDEQGSACSASAIAFTLSDNAGNIINGRSNVGLLGSGSALTVAIVLSGSDTKRQNTEPYYYGPSITQSGQTYQRTLTVRAFYNSPYGNGNGLPLVIPYRFSISPIPVE